MKRLFICILLASIFALPCFGEIQGPIFNFSSVTGLTQRMIKQAASPDSTYTVEADEQIDMTGDQALKVRCIAIIPRISVLATAGQVLEIVPRTSADGHLANDTDFTAVTKSWLAPLSFTGGIDKPGVQIIVFDRGYRYLDLRLHGDDTSNQPTIDIVGVVGSYCPPYVTADGK